MRASCSSGTELSVDEVAQRSGFGSATSLRTHLGRALGTTPSAYRGAFAGDRVGGGMPDPAVTGGCLCGGVRFELTEPATGAGYCHCTRCQHRTGTRRRPRRASTGARSACCREAT